MAKRKAPKVPVAVSIPDDIPTWDRDVKLKVEKTIAAVEVTAQTPLGKEGIGIPILKTPPPWRQSWLDEHGLKVVYKQGRAVLESKT